MASQKARLQNTAAGRAILHRTGTATELRALDGQRSLPPEVRSKITANPIPKHMNHELHEGRRKARVDRQRRQFKGDPYVTYVDVAAYPAGGLFAVAAVNGRDNSLTLAASVRAETPAAAETIAAALVIKQHDRRREQSLISPLTFPIRLSPGARVMSGTDDPVPGTSKPSTSTDLREYTIRPLLWEELPLTKELRLEIGFVTGTHHLETLWKTDPGSIYGAITDDGELYGVCAVPFIGVDMAYLALLGVVAKWRRRGIGKRLLDESLRHVGSQNVYLHCLPSQVRLFRQV
ncbi:hypothetical protein HPB49_006051 [Dermacentor silvarum]|uniref:Uncharacterized protein n=1 Tax=Dermacentor silvarum TaxID=543639 RepID=A0ACB8DBE8_DERSI|nr:hypothetical protein HPB49_006051 [Dermacentor silvarum]